MHDRFPVSLPPSSRAACRSPARRRLLASGLALCLAGLAAVLPARVSAADAVEQLRQFASETRTARGEFTQRTLRGQGQSAQTASGRFAFSRPGRFRWEVLRPFEQLMVADGERVHFYDRDLEQVTVRRLSNSLGSSPAAILFGSGDLSKEFVLTEAGSADGLAWLDARPRSTDAGFDAIRIGLRGGLPEAMEVRDAFGRTTLFTFSAIERNAAVAPDLFRFIAPKGADVIEE